MGLKLKLIVSNKIIWHNFTQFCVINKFVVVIDIGTYYIFMYLNMESMLCECETKSLKCSINKSYLDVRVCLFQIMIFGTILSFK